ncbi:MULTISPECIES: hypothetical protein [unclassified Bradyrhizobium]|uniref:ATP dependent DNA ligase n=1 Tax=unclassified Bradyrhizobium TaxID=2631580 RepID=UPI002478FDDD|nr:MULTISPECIES: hypothetical protein [unclassified Bradyrhizobium]WGR70564.1 hypothetical protein MTX24_35430 [Bradyrhizobium sp. ISRA426]WGR75401.1 hypothetical protein MTX21_20530 [Bradyrhizobium sp. ISRA430]WGR85805.1 hypothetical protein MTX25_35115 [Bradyrhizobium sp. ISRA432]
MVARSKDETGDHEEEPSIVEAACVNRDADALWREIGWFGTVRETEGEHEGSLRVAEGRDGSQQTERLLDALGDSESFLNKAHSVGPSRSNAVTPRVLATPGENAGRLCHALSEHANKLNYEGIVSKRADAPYRSDRTEAWLKVKTVQREKFPVVGFIKDPTGVAALYLGKKEGKELRYIGKVGTGWSRATSRQIRNALDTVVSSKTKLTKPVKEPKVDVVGCLISFENRTLLGSKYRSPAAFSSQTER